MFVQSHRSMARFQSLPPALDGGGDTPLTHRVLDHLQVAIAIVDMQGTVLFCNLGARQLANNSGAVKLNAGQRLGFLEVEAERKFQTALHRLGDRDSFGAESSATVVVNRPDTRNRLIGTLHLLSDNPRRVLVTLTDSAVTPSETALQCFSRAFGLTPAEQRLTHHLASGGCLSAAAKFFGVSQHTVRNQLRSIFDKVGVQRQAELMRLVSASSVCGGIAPNDRAIDASVLCADRPKAYCPRME